MIYVHKVLLILNGWKKIKNAHQAKFWDSRIKLAGQGGPVEGGTSLFVLRGAPPSPPPWFRP